MILLSLSGLLQRLEWSIILNTNQKTLFFIQGDNSEVISKAGHHYVDPLHVVWAILGFIYMFVEPVFGMITYICGLFIM